MLELRLKHKKEVIEEKIHQIDEKVAKLGDLLPKFRTEDLESEKDMLTERAARITKQERSSKKQFQQCKRKLATQLIEENRIKRRKICSGAPRLLDSDDEEYIKRAIEDKSTAHGRRHDSVLYTNKRVKKKNFLSIANYHLYRKGKKLIKSATTVVNRGKPRNKSSRAAKAHLGKWLFCSKKPPKTEKVSNECTHHQRKYVKNAKLSIFEKEGEKDGLVISVDDKAYLRPETDVGMRDVKTGRIYDVADEEKQRKLPQHDFSIPQVHVTPPSFRFMVGHKEIIDGNTHVVNHLDQTVVTNRPKHYIGSSGSVWASDTMFIRRELPQLFEVQGDQYRTCSIQLRRFCTQVHDFTFYFEDTTMYEDVMACTNNLNCKFRAYELSRLSWLERQLKNAQLRWEEDKIGIEGEDVALGNEAKDTVKVVLDTLEERGQGIRGSTKENLWEIYVYLLDKVRKIQQHIAGLNLPKAKRDVLFATDTGPGVGCSNIEVRFRDAEVARILNFDRLNRIHRARDDSGQNEAERSNACIGEAINLNKTTYQAMQGHSREIDDYQPRAQIKRHVKERKLTLEDSDSIVEFSKTFAVQELHVRKYLEHLQYLEVKKSKRKDDRKRQRETDSQKKYADYNREDMFKAGTLKKLKVSALNLFLEEHQMGNKKMKKNEKLVLIPACLAKAQLDKPTIEQAARKVNVEENTGDDDDHDYDSVHADDTDGDDNIDCGDKEYDGSSKNYDVVLHVIGSSSEEEEDDDDDEQEVDDGIEDEFCSRVGRRVTTFRSRRFFGANIT
ncbi:unnamed protein product [Porites lobata]|uniref:Uncharacterized protein n=1 Tax=Porites lobata TaxID=104759 RepID=A0ABN8S1X9_9CNID|nr:unnamed protein product [Porites lobata]